MRTAVLSAAVYLFLAASHSIHAAEQMGYRWNTGQKAAYRFEIVADLPGKVETLKGVVTYEASNDASPFKLKFSGGLTKSSKSKKATTRSGPPFGPGFFPRPPSPFSRSSNPFKGLETTTNQIVITSRGQILTLEGTSHLPHLLGNLSLLIFEPLPEGDDKSWVSESGVTITQQNQRSNDPFGGRFGPRFDPFNRFGPEAPKKTSAGGERTDFEFLRESGDLSVYTKKYSMHSPGDDESIMIGGSGTWTYNRKLQLPESLDFKQDLVRQEDNTKVTIPISIKYHRLSDDELAELEAERAERLRQARLAHEKRMAEVAEKKRQAEAPLAEAKKGELLGKLASDDPASQVGALGELAGKSPKDPDPEVAAAIEKLLASGNKSIRDKAHAALVKWSPDFKRKQDLNKAYRGPGFISAPNRPLDSDSRLFVGQIVAAKDTGAWYAAKIEALLPDGNLSVTFPGWGRRKSTVARANVQLAPEEVDQPNLSPSELAVLRGEVRPAVRTWTDATGRYRLEAQLLRLDGDVAVLKRTKDGRETRVPLVKLGKEDQEAARIIAKQLEEAAENPFEAGLEDNPFEP